MVFISFFNNFLPSTNLVYYFLILKRRMFKWLVQGFKSYPLQKEQVITTVILVFLLYTSSIMMFFGMNFWLWSFAKGLKRSYTSIFIPSICWTFLFAVFVIIMRVIHLYKGRLENYFFWVSFKGVTLLLSIGFFDSLTGLFCMYAAVHIPVLVQSALISTGPLLTYIFAVLFYPESQPPFSPILILVAFCMAAGVALAMIPQIEGHNGTKYFNLAWIVIYFFGISFFPLYNVLQGRFLNKFQGHASPFTVKIIMLTVETTVQVFLTLVYFPLDAAPFFGKCDSVKESWEMLIKSVKCIGTCPYNGVYMVVYVTGFWIRHVVFAYMNGYSPTLAAVASQLTQPINTFVLLILPSWNVYGANASWYYTLGCFLFFFLATFFSVGWKLFYDRPQVDITLTESADVVTYVADIDTETKKH